MNVVTFNDVFIPFFDAAGIDKKFLQTPLVEWSAKRREVPIEDRHNLYDENGLRVPFPAFRISGKIEFNAKENFKLVVFTSPTCQKTITCLLGGSFHGKDIIGCTFKHSSHGSTGLGSSECKAFAFIDGVFRTFSQNADDDFTFNFIKTLLAEIKNDLDLIVSDFINPHLHLCKVSPKTPQGKSVIWQKAREHYVLIHKSHVANRKESIGKKIINDGPTIDRMAHSRRAHFRLLKSPKFKHKQGQKIWIKSIWVGPKEWTDRSGQIYRIVE